MTLARLTRDFQYLSQDSISRPEHISHLLASYSSGARVANCTYESFLSIKDVLYTRFTSLQPDKAWLDLGHDLKAPPGQCVAPVPLTPRLPLPLFAQFITELRLSVDHAG